MILTLNNPQENLQLIQINNDYVVVDLVAEIKEHNWICPIKDLGFGGNEPQKFNIDTFQIGDINIWENNNDNIFKKIMFASQSFNLGGVKVIEELFIPTILPTKKQVNDGLEIPIWVNGYKEGYKQAKENSPYTLEQLKEAIEFGRNYQLTGENNFTEFVNSLNQPKAEITFDDNNQPLTVKLL